MSNLIMTLIGIALTGLLLVIGMNYSGDNLDQASVTVQATHYLNESQMISGAYDMYKSDTHGKTPAGLNTLLDAKYLKNLPANEWSITDTDGIIAQAVNVPEEVCKEINKKVGFGDSVPECTAPNLPDAICCNSL